MLNSMKSAITVGSDNFIAAAVYTGTEYQAKMFKLMPLVVEPPKEEVLRYEPLLAIESTSFTTSSSLVSITFSRPLTFYRFDNLAFQMKTLEGTTFTSYSSIAPRLNQDNPRIVEFSIDFKESILRGELIIS